MNQRRVVIIGGGASGMIAAGRAAECGADALLLEKMPRPGQKILISGKTRCNLTNIRELDDFILMFGPNGRFLYPAFHAFFRNELLSLMGRYGVATKTERGGRVFPVSDDARDVVKALERYMSDSGARVTTEHRVTGLRVEQGKVLGVRAGESFFSADAVVLATGGASFVATGSSGDGYTMAEAVGHTVIKLRPALVPLLVREIDTARKMQGASLRNVRLTSFQCLAEQIDPSLTPSFDYGRGIPGKRPPRPVIESRMGEMIMTHFGIGGPITLQMSLAIVAALEKGPVSVSIDLKPALTIPELRQRLQREFDGYGKRSYHNLLKELLPGKMIEPVAELSGIPGDKPGHQINAGEREVLCALLKSLRFNIQGPLPLAAAMVTAGGVSLKEIEPRTMASRLVKGLYFCGEVMDLDAETGGYNLQAAFSTGHLAGESAARLTAC